jgi:hypothetical protein
MELQKFCEYCIGKIVEDNHPNRIGTKSCRFPGDTEMNYDNSVLIVAADALVWIRKWYVS